MDLATLRKSFGEGTEDEIVAGCSKVDPRIDDFDKAKAFIWTTLSSLLDNRMYRAAAHLLWGREMFDPRPKSVDRMMTAMDTQAKIVFLGSGSSGKCMKKGTEILMADGSVKAIENISVGDRVMGPDSTSRKVTETHSGKSEMFEVVTNRGHGFTCNKDHILTLVCGLGMEEWDNLFCTM